jgi:hypothetical protein
MKKMHNLILLAFVVFSLPGCYIDIWEEPIYGKGPVITEERDIHGFNGIKVSSGIDVYLKQGNSEKVKVVADENLHDVIETEVRNGILHIFTEVSIRRPKSKKVYVTIEKLNSIRISSAGDVRGQNKIQTKNLTISLSSAGDLILDIEAKLIELSISSSGDANLTGSSDYLDASLSSAGNLNAYDLEAKKCKIKVSSAGNAKIYVTDELSATASSAGDIYYLGDPKIKNLSSSSAGGIHKR